MFNINFIMNRKVFKTMKGGKIMITTGILLLSAGVIGAGVWYLNKDDNATKQQNISSLSVGNKTIKDDNKSSETTDKRLVVDSSISDYTYNEESGRGSKPLENEEYQNLIDENSTIQANDTGQEVSEEVKNEVIAKISEAITAFPKANPNFSSSPEMYQYYEVANEQFGDEDALKELQNIIQFNEVQVGTVNVAQTTTKNEIAYEFIILKSDTGEQVGYSTGFYDTETKKLKADFSTILRDGQIIQNNWLEEHKQS